MSGTVDNGVDARRSEYDTNDRRLLWFESGAWLERAGEEGGSSRVAVAGELCIE